MKFFSVIFSTKIFAQSKIENQLGIGISIDPSRIGQITYYTFRQESLVFETAINNSPILFYLPINVADHIRIEPMFGLFSTSDEYSNKNDNSNYFGLLESDAITIGISGLYLVPLSNYFDLYFGTRISLTFLSHSVKDKYETNYDGNYQSTTYKVELSERDLNVGLVFGGEYFPVSHFSFGGEASFNYISLGNPDTKNTIIPEPIEPSNATLSSERKRHSVRTNGIFFVRWYFF